MVTIVIRRVENEKRPMPTTPSLHPGTGVLRYLSERRRYLEWGQQEISRLVAFRDLFTVDDFGPGTVSFFYRQLHHRVKNVCRVEPRSSGEE